MNRRESRHHDNLVSGYRNGSGHHRNGAGQSRGFLRVNGSVGGFEPQTSNLSKPFDNQHLFDSSTPLKSLKLILKQFEMIEKRYWPYFLKDLNELFKRDSFSRAAIEKSHRVVDDFTRVLSRILTTKLFPDIIIEVVNCLTSLSSALRSNSRDLFQWMFDFYDSVSDETRIVLLKSLTKIIQGKFKGIGDNMSAMMIKLKMILESNNSSFVLIELTEIFVATGNSYPSIFQKYFMDVIDILIGWYIDSASDPGMTRRLTKAFIGFGEFFVQDIESSLVLLQNFMEDFEKEFEKRNKLRNDECGDKRMAVNKMASLVSMYTTILRSLGSFAYPQRNFMITSNFIEDSLKVVMSTVGNMIGNAEVNEHLITACNECVNYTIEMSSDDTSSFMGHFSAEILKYLDAVIENLDNSDDYYIISTIKVVTTVVRTLGNDIPPELIPKILGSESKCMKLRFHPAKQIQESLFELHHSFLAIKNVPRLEDSYKCFLFQLQISLSYLMKKQIELVVDIDIDSDVHHFENEPQALIVLKSTLISLTELSNAKHSLIAMWALKPSFFDLVIDTLSPFLVTFSQNNPDVEYLILFLLFSHCEKHNHFISSSNLFNKSSQNSSSNDQMNFSSIISPPTTGHLTKIISLLHKVLSLQTLSTTCRHLCVSWCRQILDNVGESNFDQFFNEPCFRLLIKDICELMMMKDENLAIAALDLMTNFMKKPIDTHLLTSLRQICLMKMASCNERVRSKFTSFIQLLPLGINEQMEWSDEPLIIERSCIIRMEDVVKSKEALMKRETNAFPSWYFKVIIGFMLDPQQSDDEMFELMCRMFTSSLADSASLKLPLAPAKTVIGNSSYYFGSEKHIWSVFQSDRSCLIFWSMWEIVAYCICNKLRTPLGRPQELLTKIQFTLNEVLNTNNLSPSRVRMLLTLMEVLDKQITNAIEGGGSIRLHNPSQVARTFFKTNKVTCVDWMTRNRLTVAKIATNTSDCGIVWRNCSELLESLLTTEKLSEKDIEHVCLLMVDNYIRLRDVSSINGLVTFLKQRHNLEFSWMNAAVLEADFKYEKAADRYLDILETYTKRELIKNNNNDVDEQEMAKKRMIELYLKVDDYENAIKWSAFETKTLEEKMNKLSVSSLSCEMNEFDKLANTNRVVKVSTEKLISIVDTTLCPTISKIVASKFEEAHSELTSLTQHQTLSEFPLVDERVVILLKVSHWLSQRKNERGIFKVDFVDNCLKDIDPSCLISIMKWSNFLNKNDPDVEMMLSIAKAGRKSENFQLVSRMLRQCLSIEATDEKELIERIEHLSTNSSIDIKVATESSLFLFKTGKEKKAIELLTKVGEGNPNEPSSPENIERSRSLVKLYKMTLTEPLMLDQNQKSKFETYISSSTIRSNRIPDVIISGILESASSLDPLNSKSFYHLGNWSYETSTKRSKETIHDVNEFISLITLATKSLFTFIQLNVSGSEDMSTASCLKLLNVITKNASELRGILKNCLSSTPTAPWKCIIIQLMASLSHFSENQLVSEHILGLLCKIAKDFPESIVFPAVSRSLPPKNSASTRLVDRNVLKLSKLTENDLSFDDPDTDRSQNLDHSLQELNGKPSIYSSIVSILTSVNPLIVSSTIQFITEMRRINVLWDELWIVALMSKLSEVKKKVSTLEEEVSKVSEMSDWSRGEKESYISKYHEASFKKIVDLLSETQEATINCYPETSHEKWFQSSFSELIESVVNSIGQPADLLRPQQILTMYQKLIQELQRRSAEMSNGRSQLVMDTISPVLANMSKTYIPMPGSKGKQVTIEKVSKTVTTLHTKTKPKKVSFCGSNGQIYTFLYKGHEDMHLDERIMQFLDAINGIFRRHKNKMGKYTLRARQYSVTPLGTKSGLIEWVDGPPPLFNFYKRWIKTQQEQSNNSNSIDEQVKPSEIFNKKLFEKNLIPTSDRKEWPTASLIEIHQELVNETSSKIISRELWMASTTSYNYYQMVQTFSRSVAVMSIIGYVLGLGDRHLDNILLDLFSGEVIHVDYNICFEKGKTLRVPERVPFRLTNSIVGTFGLTGIEGPFRLTCEHVMKILRKERHTLLLLLDAFLYDPLAEWSVYLPSNSSTVSKESKPNFNPYAVKILKKVKSKLEGVEGTSAFNQDQMPISDQVDTIIKQAMDVTNLSHMYEGWTSWV